MPNQVFVNGTAIRLHPNQAIGKGGEADVFVVKIGGVSKAIKIYKPPNHPDYTGQPTEQAGARERIATHQRKLPSFPKNLPPRVVTPEELAYDRQGGAVVGYTMRFLPGSELLIRYSEKSFRQKGVANNTVVQIYQDLHPTVAGIHQAGAVIGDFNDLNVLVLGTEAYIIDADSFQFGPFPCRVFTARFVDPLLCDPNATSLMLVRQHTANSDWYAYTVMLMQSLLFTGPYGGVYPPKFGVKLDQRPLRRITVFHRDVLYPKPAIPYTVLPDDLLQHFHLVFEKDQRGVFPLHLLLNLRWTTCSQCGAEHARGVCPHCATAAPAAVKEVITARGTVVATKIFTTRGHILYAAHQGGMLRWLYHEQDQFRREDGSVVAHGGQQPGMRYRLSGSNTLLAQGNQLVTFAPGQPTQQQRVDTYGNLPVIDGNAESRFWLENGELKRDGQYAPMTIGSVLPNQTLFWVGPTFGFGFYRAGALSVAFVFDTRRPGLNDSVQLPLITGQLVDATCVFTEAYCWFFVSTRTGGQSLNYCYQISRTGQLVASAQAIENDGTWLGSVRGKGAIGNLLFAPTDEGIKRVEDQSGMLIVTREFPDTEAYVSSASNLFLGRNGLFVVNGKEVYQLRIS